MIGRTALSLALAVGTAVATPSFAQDAPYQREARQVLERVVGFRTAAGHAQVPAMVGYLTGVLRAGGVSAADIVTIPHGETVALLVRVPGQDASARPILLSSHMDVVDARPEDWQRSPYTLIEENGYFFGRGTTDNKTGVVSLVSTVLRLTADGHRPRRTLVFAFVGDEETEMKTTELIAAHDWVRTAEYAINTDAGGGNLSDDGKPLYYGVQGAEKTYVDFQLVTTNPGGHSSRPRADNAIYDLARAIGRIEQHRFEVRWNALTRSYLGTIAPVVAGQVGDALRRFAANPDDREAADILWRVPEYVGTTRTTCVATMLEAGHAPNALPQRATATVNCRLFPGDTVADVRRALGEVIGNPAIRVETLGKPEPSPVSEPRADVMEAIARSIHARYPGVPITPYLESGGTDGKVYRTAGIPTWATSGAFMKDSEMFAHGLDERIPVKAFYDALEHIHDLAVALGRE